MCLGAIYWARLSAVSYANTRSDAAAIGFDDEFLYKELSVSLPDRRIPMKQLLRSEALLVFREWGTMENKIRY